MADPAAPSVSIVLKQAIGADVWTFGSNGTLLAGVPGVFTSKSGPAVPLVRSVKVKTVS